MPQIPIIMPQLGEAIAEATILRVLVEAGATVEADQDVFEVETNKAIMNVASPCPGRLQKLLVKLEESYPVGAILGYLEASQEDVARLGLDRPVKPEAEEASDAVAGSQRNGGRRREPAARRGTDRARAARARQRDGSQLHFAAHEGPDG